MDKTSNKINSNFKNFKEISLEEDFQGDPHLIAKKKNKLNNINTNTKLSKESEIYTFSEKTDSILLELTQSTKSENNFSELENIEYYLSMTNDFLNIYESDTVIEGYKESQKSENSKNTGIELLNKKKEEKQIKKDLTSRLDDFLKKIEEEENNESETNNEEEDYEEEIKDFSIEEENKLAESENRKFRIVRLNTKKNKGEVPSNTYQYAIEDERDLSDFYINLPKEKFAMDFPFELDDFQKRAILHLEQKVIFILFAKNFFKYF